MSKGCWTKILKPKYFGHGCFISRKQKRRFKLNRIYIYKLLKPVSTFKKNCHIFFQTTKHFNLHIKLVYLSVPGSYFCTFLTTQIDHDLRLRASPAAAVGLFNVCTRRRRSDSSHLMDQCHTHRKIPLRAQRKLVTKKLSTEMDNK